MRKFKKRDIKEAIHRYYDGRTFNVLQFFKDFENDRNLKKLVLYCIEEALREEKYKFQVVLEERNICVSENEAIFLVPFLLYPSRIKGEVKKIILKYFDKWKDYLKRVNESSKQVLVEYRKKQREELKKKIESLLLDGLSVEQILKVVSSEDFAKYEIEEMINEVRNNLLSLPDEEFEKRLKKKKYIEDFDKFLPKKVFKIVLEEAIKELKKGIQTGKGLNEAIKEKKRLLASLMN